MNTPVIQKTQSTPKINLNENSEVQNGQIDYDFLNQQNIEITNAWTNLLTANSENISTVNTALEQPMIVPETKANPEEFKLGMDSKTHIVFEKKEVSTALTDTPDFLTVKQEVVEVEEFTTEDVQPSENQKLIDFKLFGSFVGQNMEEAFPKAVDISKKLWKTSQEIQDALFGIFTEFIFFKVKDKEAQKKEQAEKEKKGKKTANVREFYGALKNAIPQANGVNSDRLSYANQRLNLNTNFEGSIVNGALRADLEIALAKKEQEETEDQKKKRMKEAMVASAGKSKAGQKAKSGIADLNMAAENQSHWSKALG